MSTVESWIHPYLGRYIATVGPHDWPDDPDEMRFFVEGWVEAFKIAGIAEAEADAARVRLALHAPEYRKKHLPAVVEVVLKMRERDATRRLVEAVATSPAQARAEVASRGCPECKGNGWALRKGIWADRSWGATATLYCRCPMGRYRLAREEGDRAPYDDLQALPALWDRELAHPSWSDVPGPPPSVEGRSWRYLAPGEPAPPPIAVHAVRPASRASSGRRRDWSGPIPDDLPMPRPVSRREREPEPATAEPPTDHLDWM